MTINQDPLKNVYITEWGFENEVFMENQYFNSFLDILPNKRLNSLLFLKISTPQTRPGPPGGL